MHSPFPFSAGQAVASTPLTPGACDCHIHVYDDSVAPVAGAAMRPPQATVADYHHIQASMGALLQP